jgi:hypothetical protein
LVFKKIFGGGKREVAGEELTIEDLFVLERYEEAESRLKARLQHNPQDLHAHLRLADVYIQLRQLSKAVDEYVYVAEEHAADGFFDKGIALLSKVSKLAPLDETLPQKIEKIRQRKRQERVRELALEGLRHSLGAGGGSGSTGSTVLELQGLWGNLLRCSLVRRLDGPQLKHLFSFVKLVRLEDRDVVAERNSDAQVLFILVRGDVEATASISGGPPIQLRRFGPGDIVGEAALLERKPWAATYSAKGDLVVLKLTREGLEKALTGNDDPRGLLDALREQRNDQAVALAIHQLSR